MKLSILVFALSFVSTMSGFAQNVDPVDKNKVANGGYDLVAYFVDNAPAMGKKDFTYEYKGVKYLFASNDHKLKFAKEPEKYLPVCGGYCAWGVAEKGIKVPVNPQTFKVIDGKLYLFFNGQLNGSPLNTLPEWNKNEGELLTKISGNWEKLNK